MDTWRGGSVEQNRWDFSHLVLRSKVIRQSANMFSYGRPWRAGLCNTGGVLDARRCSSRGQMCPIQSRWQLSTPLWHHSRFWSSFLKPSPRWTERQCTHVHTQCTWLIESRHTSPPARTVRTQVCLHNLYLSSRSERNKKNLIQLNKLRAYVVILNRHALGRHTDVVSLHLKQQKKKPT